MSIASVSSYLVTKVQAIAGVNAGAVFDYENPTMDAFPWITITVKDWANRFLDNQRNLTTYTFSLRIYQETTATNMGPATSESNLRSLCDLIIASFNADNKLGGTDVWTIPIAGRSGWVSGKPIRYFELDIQCNDVLAAIG